jgi:DNA-binding HxlR family transcriptional regulator
MAAMRTYNDPCGVARALDLVGERWALLIARELLLGPKRFTDLRAGLPHLSPDVLSQRLREFERAGVVRRRKLAPPAGSRVYELTEWGLELEPVVLGLGRWGSRAPFPSEDSELGPDAFVLALKTLFDATAAAGLIASYELRLGEHSFDARVAEGRFEVQRGTAAVPDATIETDPATLSGILWHGRPLAAALGSGGIRIEGSEPSVTRLLGLFPAPVPAPLVAEA